MNVSIRPLYDRIVVECDPTEEKSRGGIVIPDSASKERPVRGKVIAVGTGKPLDNGDFRALTVKVGDRVLFGKYAGTEIKLGDVEVVVMREDDIMGVITD